MRIDKLQVTNFKAFSDATFEFHPNFNLIVGENGAGKTSLLKSIAVALGAWGYGFPVMPIREIGADEVRRVNIEKGGRPTFELQFPSRIKAYGKAFDKDPTVWQRSKDKASGTTTVSSPAEVGYATINFKHHGELIAKAISSGDSKNLPLLAFYGTGRLWQKPAVEANQEGTAAMAGSVFSGYEDCFSARTSEEDLKSWLLREIGAVAAKQVPDSVLLATKTAIRNMLPGAVEIHAYYLPTVEIVIEFEGGGRVAFSSLSDGQRTLLNLAGDIARRAVTLNPHLGGRALSETEGVVLIDELDLHLHPRWQRRVVSDLKRSFTQLQFFATTHSPQIVGETAPEQILILSKDGSWTRPNQTVGLDTNEVLTDIMHADTINKVVEEKLAQLDKLLADGEFTQARENVELLRNSYGDLARLAGAEAYMARMEILADQPEATE